MLAILSNNIWDIVLHQRKFCKSNQMNEKHLFNMHPFSQFGSSFLLICGNNYQDAGLFKVWHMIGLFGGEARLMS